MPARNPRVKVPASFGESFTVSYGGDDPETYTPDNGVVTVKPEHVDRFLGAVDGASLVKSSSN